MSAQSVETILSRAMHDVEFAVELLCNPRQALASYPLTSQEVMQFERLAQADFDAFPSISLEERRSFGRSNHNQLVLKVK